MPSRNVLSRPTKLISITTAVPSHMIDLWDAVAMAHSALSDRFKDLHRLAKRCSRVRAFVGTMPSSLLNGVLNRWAAGKKCRLYRRGYSLFVDAAKQALEKELFEVNSAEHQTSSLRPLLPNLCGIVGLCIWEPYCLALVVDAPGSYRNHREARQ